MEEEEEEEAVFISVVNTNKDPPQEEEEVEAVFISVVNTNEDPPNAHQAQHCPDTCQGAVNFPNGAVPSGAR